MPEPCETDTMPRHCAEKFEEISHSLAQMARIADDVTVLRKAVVGNGRAEQSLTFRVTRLEQGSQYARQVRARWGERLWKLLAAIALVIFGWWLGSP